MRSSLLSTLPLAIGLLFGGSLEVRDQVERAEIERVKVRWAAGTVRASVHDDGKVQATSLAWGPEAPMAFSSRRDGEILYLELRCRTPAPCGGDLDLTVPEGVQLEVELGEGLAQLAGPLGETTAIVGKGSIEASALGGARAVLQVVDGDVRASWSEAPVRVVLATVTGDAELLLPPDEYEVEDARGTVRLVGMHSVPGAARSIEVTNIDGTTRLHAVRSVASLR